MYSKFKLAATKQTLSVTLLLDEKVLCASPVKKNYPENVESIFVFTS